MKKFTLSLFATIVLLSANTYGVPTLGSVLAKAVIEKLFKEAFYNAINDYRYKTFNTIQGMQELEKAYTETKQEIEDKYDSRINEAREKYMQIQCQYDAKNYYSYEQEKKKKLEELKAHIDALEKEKQDRLDYLKEQKQYYFNLYQKYWEENDKRIINY